MQIRQLLSLKVHGERFLVGQIQVRFQVLGDVLLVLWNKQCSEEIREKARTYSLTTSDYNILNSHECSPK